ncbi:uncharacterized protein LOC127698930 isoform X8 [Mytilus californianus]|uniref:uncharacterized protein LOC127698930 isoform X8 n=1 Tax=Mytilus californianus TaxID=6549 RepID=UPI0022479C57|nr:uncharacterized protein LOC127698930 isoform X8 [Mytilus californianus]
MKLKYLQSHRKSSTKMPSSIVPINLTRDFSIKPAHGLRYGNFEGVVYLPPTTKYEKRGEQNFSKLNNQQIYKKICDWFEVWRSWQQQHLLCGIIDRCSITQLDILATTLEPVRHRDYAAAYKHRYPSTPFKVLKQRQESRNYKLTFEEPVKQPLKSNLISETPGQLFEFDVAGDGRIDLLEDIVSSTDSPGSRQLEKQDTFDRLCEVRANINPFEKYVTDLTESIIQQAVSHAAVLHKYGTATKYKGEEPVYHTPRQGVVSQVSFASTDIESTDVEGDEGRENITSLRDITNQSLARETNISHLRDTNISMRETDTTLRGLAKSQQYSRIRVLSPTIIETSNKVYREKSYSSVHSDMSKSLEHFSSRNTSQVRQHLFGSNAASTPDFFTADTETVHKLGPMQRQIRFGTVQKPRGVDDLPVTLQKSYKNVKWWTGAPKKGKIFLKAQKVDLMSNFKDQLKQIWTWQGQWEGYEKINLLKEVLKLCGDEVLSQLTTHIQQRIRDTRDVNRLSDKLLLYIFSFLTPHEIFRASQVCRRWRFLCDTDDLWMIKCHELGVKEGIDNMDDIVMKSNQNKMGIDWKLAYMELQRITRMMKWDAKQRDSRFAKELLYYELRAAEEAERLRKQKEEEGLSTSVLDFQDLLEKYCKLFHLSPLEEELSVKSVSVIAELEVKRGTLSRLQKHEEKRQLREITAAAAKAELESKTKVQEKEDDVSSEVSSEDLEEYMDSVFQVVKREKTRSSSYWKKLRPLINQARLQDIERTQQQVKARKALKEREKKEKLEKESKKKSKATEKTFAPEQTRTVDTEKKTDETAFDIRTDLIQARDILGKSMPSMKLEWRQMEDTDDKTPRPFEMPRYMGIVKSVKRVRRLQGHLNSILCVHFDKKRLISAGLDRTIRLWDIRSGKSIHKFYGHKGGIRCLQFEGNTLLTGSWDTTIIVWDLRTFEKRTVLAKHTDCVSCLYIGPEYIISGSYDKTVRVWFRQTLIQWKVIRGHTAAVNSVSCDGDYFVSGSSDMTLRLVNIQTSECLRIFSGCQDQILSVVMQGDLVISGDSGGHVYFWNKETGETEAAVQAHDGQIHKICFHKGRFFTASSDSTVREWDLMSMTSVRVLQGHKGPVRDIKVTEDRFVTCSEDGTIRIWDLFDSRRPGIKL